MNILIRPVRHDQYESIEVDAVACTVIGSDVSEMSAVLDAFSIDKERFICCEAGGTSSDGAVKLNNDTKPKVITIAVTDYWEFEHEVPLQVVRAAGASQCRTLCIAQFAFMDWQFPEQAFLSFMQAVTDAQQVSQLEKIVVDVDERYVDEAKATYKKVAEQQKFIARHRVNPKTVRLAEAGDTYYQRLLAVDLWVKSNDKDRSLHAYKWLIIAWTLDGEFLTNENWINCLAEAMGHDQFDLAATMAMDWLAQNNKEFD